MRILSNDAVLEIAKKTGTEPINVIEIDWPIPNGDVATAIYSDRSLENVSLNGLILKLDNIDEIVTLSDGATASQVSITLDDTSSIIKQMMNQYDIQKRPIRVYQFFNGLNYEQDKFLIFSGEIVTPIVWSERERQVTFEAITRTRDVEVGFAPEEGQFKDVSSDNAGKVWPLVFGSPIYVPATLTYTSLVGVLTTRMGVPDPTLPYKKELLEYRRDQLNSAIEYYTNLRKKTDKQSRAASEIQLQYTNHIIAYDGLKQVIEDTCLQLEALNLRLDELNQDWNDPMILMSRNEIEDEYKAVRDTRNKFRAIVKGLYAQQRQMEQAELAFKQEIENAKYFVGLIDKLGKKLLKLRKDIIEINKEISIILQATIFQATLNQTTANVWDGKKFPQDEDKRYEINQAVFVASMHDRVLNFKSIVSKYVNVQIGPRKNESLDLFWLKQDPNEDVNIFKDQKGKLVNLSNMYALTNNNRVIRIIEQKQDGQCKIELPPRITTKKTAKKEVDYSGNAIDKNAFDTGLTHLLSGNETDEQKQKIANELPKDISPKIWNLLNGGLRKQYIELKSGTGDDSTPLTDFSQSYFQLAYGDEGITSQIFFTDDAIQIKNKIAQSILQLDKDSIKVEKTNTCTDPKGNDGFQALTIEFTKGLMKPLRFETIALIVDPLEDRKDSLKITSIGTNDPGATLGFNRDVLKVPNQDLTMRGMLTLIVNGTNLDFVDEEIEELTGDTLQDYFENVPARPKIDDELDFIQPICQPREITCVGGPLKNSNIEITYNTDFRPILIDTSRMSIGIADGDIKLPLKLSQLNYDEVQDAWYQELYFDRNQLINPLETLELFGDFKLRLSKDGDSYTIPFTSLETIDSTKINQRMWNESVLGNEQNFLAVGGSLATSDLKIYLDMKATNTTLTLEIVENTFEGQGLGKEAAFGLADFNNKFSPIKTRVYLGITYRNQGASEYTVRQREKKLTEEIEKDINSPAILKYRKQLQAFIAEYREAVLTGDLDDALRFDLEKNLSIFANINNKIDDSSFNLEEYYRLISKDEKKALYELEILAFLEWRLKLKEIKDDDDEDINLYEFTAKDFTSLKEVSPVILKSWISYLDTKPKNVRDFIGSKFWKMKEISLLPNNTAPFIGEVGDKVVLEDEFQEKYIANVLPSTIKGVHAWKYVNGVKRMVPLSDRMYKKNENDETYGEMMTVTSITLTRPLKFYDPNWIEGIYVTLQSPVGPNVCNILKYIIEHYTTCTADSNLDETGTFDIVKTYMRDGNGDELYPCNFAILEKIDAFDLLQDIAWQARCKLWIKEEVVYIMYLPKEPVPIATLNASTIEENSLELSFTPTEELVTSLKARWKPDYSKERDWEMTVRRNIRRYGEQREERNIYIYNDQDLVYKTITFWLIRWSNTYKLAKVRVFLDSLFIETNDYITFAAPNPFANGEISGLVVKADYDSVYNGVDLTVWLPVISGTMSKYEFAMPADLSTTTLFPDPLDVKNGDAGNPYNVNVPTGKAFDPYDPSLEDLRPRDFGKSDISDLNDLIPKNPASEFDEVSYDVTPLDKLDPTTKFKYSYTNIDAEPFNLEQEALEFEAEVLDLKSSNEELLVAYGRVIKPVKADQDEDEIVPENGGNVITRKYYWVELSNGKMVKARPYQVSKKGVPYNQVMLIVKDSFNKDYVFQPIVTTGRDFENVK